ncbi:hypothetical protein MUK42_18005 [Musa troglodytarum]|uniref:Uncharacterized protein n=1 Tax=Musa troglodytarum TaxID=320322 RepID=A0A9E7H6Y5_9LILI|nr:hypothetical protein MUK42_18005 [Musa troglodytarum]
MSERILSSARVSCRGQRLPGAPPRSASSPAPRASSSGNPLPMAGPSSSKPAAAGGRLLMGDAASASSDIGGWRP